MAFAIGLAILGAFVLMTTRIYTDAHVIRYLRKRIDELESKR